MPTITMKKHFKTIQRLDVEYSPNVITQYVSERTGLKLVVVDQKGPKVYGYFALATEIHDDSGAPHTLEHLVFMGSKNYSFKGVLDKLATRAYSSTNAWTATDHTAYTLDSAGWEGFAQILPVYLEHILFPTLSDSGCYTEVHHIDGAGKDAGVVYSEMQGVQNTQSSLVDLKARRLIYPEGVGFRYETGGMMEQLRVLTAERIRAFHKEMYQPKNLCLVIIGEVDHDCLLEILDEFEGQILPDIPVIDEPFKRPWVTSKQTPPLTTTIETVEFPEEDETTGEVQIAFLGPPCNDTLLCDALSVLLVYLAGSSISILENTLVEKEQLASYVGSSTESRPNTLVWFVLGGVATGKLAAVEARFFEVLKDTASKPLDLEYMRDCVHRQMLQIEFYSESYGNYFSTAIINDFLFGDPNGLNLKDLSTLKEYSILESWSDEQWRDFLRTWISDAPHISILGTPSAKLSKRMKADEEARVAEQIKTLGEDGLKRLEQKLADAKAENDKEVPKSILEKYHIPGAESIHFIESITARSGSARKLGVLDNKIQKIIDLDKPDLPLFIHFEHVATNFIHLTVVLCTGSIPLQMKPLLTIYLANFFDTPITRDGQRIEFEKVVTELEKDTVSYTIDGGTRVGNPELIRIRFQVEPKKYERAIKWLQEMMIDSIFDITRLKSTVAKMIADIPDEKRSGNSMAFAIDNMIHFLPESSNRARNTLVKAIYLKRVKRLLDDEPETIISHLEEVRQCLCKFENFRVLVISNLEKLPHPVTSWAGFVEKLDTSKALNPLDSRILCIGPDGLKPGKQAFIVPMATIDSSFSLHTARGIDSHADPQLPAIMVAVAYLDAVEGPLWRAVRGTGLAYGTGFIREVGTGLIQFRVYRSPDAFKAFAASKAVIEDHISGKAEFEPSALEGAISTIIVSFADEQRTMNAAAQISFVNQVIKGVPSDYNAQILKKVRNVSNEEIKTVLKNLVLPVFMPGSSNFVVTCAPVLQETIKASFEAAGYSPQVKHLSDFQEDYGLKTKDGEEDTKEEEEEEFSEGGDADEGSEGDGGDSADQD
ncbi:MAG: hypothetical protein M1829_006438 [Trizodia sp. TS-e1964]|nr:MAG: hypothetical protein M1829_006438 [Trizodia sp. TS-e1964]